MTDNKMTPELPRNNWELMREWHPDYKSVSERVAILSAATCRTIEGTKEDRDAQAAERDFLGQSFSAALAAYADHIRKEERHDIEWQYSDLVEELKTIWKVTPKSFKSLTEEDRCEGYYLASCKCGWWGSSALLEGGGAIADTGDHFDCTCPFCGSADIGEMNDPYREVWDQACKAQREECAEAWHNAIAEIGEPYYESIDKVIRTAPAPEFKITEKE